MYPNLDVLTRSKLTAWCKNASNLDDSLHIDFKAEGQIHSINYPIYPVSWCKPVVMTINGQELGINNNINDIAFDMSVIDPTTDSSIASMSNITFSRELPSDGVFENANIADPDLRTGEEYLRFRETFIAFSKGMKDEDHVIIKLTPKKAEIAEPIPTEISLPVSLDDLFSSDDDEGLAYKIDLSKLAAQTRIAIQQYQAGMNATREQEQTDSEVEWEVQQMLNAIQVSNAPPISFTGVDNSLDSDTDSLKNEKP